MDWYEDDYGTMRVDYTDEEIQGIVEEAEQIRDDLFDMLPDEITKKSGNSFEFTTTGDEYTIGEFWLDGYDEEPYKVYWRCASDNKLYVFKTHRGTLTQHTSSVAGIVNYFEEEHL